MYSETIEGETHFRKWKKKPDTPWVSELTVKMAQEGDFEQRNRAFSEIYAKTSRWLFLVFKPRHKKLSPEELQDVVNETFDEAFKCIKKFRGESAFTTWLYAVGRYRLSNFYRSSKKRRILSLSTMMESDPYLLEDATPDCEMFGFRREMSPEEALIHSESLGSAREAIEYLRKKYLNLYVPYEMFEFQGITYEEIANELEIPIGTVRSRIYRAREILKEVLMVNLNGKKSRIPAREKKESAKGKRSVLVPEKKKCLVESRTRNPELSEKVLRKNETPKKPRRMVQEIIAKEVAPCSSENNNHQKKEERKGTTYSKQEVQTMVLSVLNAA